jgi:hypothetical protein
MKRFSNLLIKNAALPAVFSFLKCSDWQRSERWAKESGRQALSYLAYGSLTDQLLCRSIKKISE